MGPEDQPLRMMCARHPAVETGLRCAHCGTPICPRCLVQAPVGARCPDCAQPRGGLAAHPTISLYGRSIAAGLAAGVGAGALLAVVPLGFLAIFATLLVGY